LPSISYWDQFPLRWTTNNEGSSYQNFAQISFPIVIALSDVKISMVRYLPRKRNNRLFRF